MASYLPDLTRDNISLNTIPLAWAICLVPRMWGRWTFNKAAGKDMDTRHPREFSKQAAEDSSLDEKTRGRILRAEAAMANGFENIGLFAAAVVAGNVAKLPPKLLNGLSLGYIVSREVYMWIYICNDTKLLAAGRALAFFGGIGTIFTLFIKAGNKLRNAAL